MPDAVVTNDILSFAKNGYKEVGDLRQAVVKAVRDAADQEKNLENELRAKLAGKLVIVTGKLETQEVLLQGGHEYVETYRSVSDERLVITGIFITREKYDSTRTPLIYADYEEAHKRKLLGGGVAFRLLTLTKLEILG